MRNRGTWMDFIDEKVYTFNKFKRSPNSIGFQQQPSAAELSRSSKDEKKRPKKSPACKPKEDKPTPSIRTFGGQTVCLAAKTCS